MLKSFCVTILGWAFAVGAAALADDQARFSELNSDGWATTGQVSLREILEYTCSGTISGLDDGTNGCLPADTWETPYYE